MNNLAYTFMTPDDNHYLIRSKLYAGLCSASMHAPGFFDDDTLKILFVRFCWHCGTTQILSVGHIILQSTRRLDGGKNLTYT